MNMHNFYVVNILDSSLLNNPLLLSSLVLDSNENARLSIVDEVSIADNLIQYILDTFSWVKSDDVDHYGLNYHGVTLFPATSCEALRSIVSGWISIFSTCQDTIELKGNYHINAGVVRTETLVFKKEDILTPLQNLLKLVNKTLEPLFLLHLGI